MYKDSLSHFDKIDLILKVFFSDYIPGSAKATSPQSSASNCGSKVTRVTAAPPLQPNTRIPPPPPRPLDRESTTIPNPVAMVTFKGCATPPPSYSPTRQTSPLHSSAPSEYSREDHRHSPGGASNNASRQSDDAQFVEFATDV